MPDIFNVLCVRHGGQIHIQARVGFAGFLMETFCFYMLMYMVGECCECAMPGSRPALAEMESRHDVLTAPAIAAAVIAVGTASNDNRCHHACIASLEWLDVHAAHWNLSGRHTEHDCSRVADGRLSQASTSRASISANRRKQSRRRC